MKKAVILTTLALVACVALAAPLKRIVQGTAAAGVQTDHTFAEWDGREGQLGSIMIKMDAAATGNIDLKVTRGGTVHRVYRKALSADTDHVFWFGEALWLLSTDTLSVSNGTAAAATYSITITK